MVYFLSKNRPKRIRAIKNKKWQSKTAIFQKVNLNIDNFTDIQILFLQY